MLDQPDLRHADAWDYYLPPWAHPMRNVHAMLAYIKQWYSSDATIATRAQAERTAQRLLHEHTHGAGATVLRTPVVGG